MAEDFRKALIVGAGAGLSAALARAFAKEGLAIALAARSTDDLKGLAAETRAQVHACDASRRADVERLFGELDTQGAPDVVAYNASYRTRGPFVELDPDEVEKSLRVSALAGFYVAQAAAKRMLAKGHGAIFFTGASASVKGYAQSAPFAMGKFALRGLAQSMARELAPKGLHVAHFVIDGGISRGPEDPRRDRGADGLLEPAAIAESYLHVHGQQRSAWTWEVELRP